MAEETNAIIVPLAIEQYGKDFIVNIGENIDFSQKTDMNLDEKNQFLRDAMAQLKYEIFESVPSVKRSEISIDSEQFAQEIISRCPYEFTKADVQATRYHDKSEVDPEEVFAFRKRLNLK